MIASGIDPADLKACLNRQLGDMTHFLRVSSMIAGGIDPADLKDGVLHALTGSWAECT